MGVSGFLPVGWLGERCGIAPPGLPRQRRHSAIRTACLWPVQRAGRPRSSTGIILALDIAFSDMDARRGPFDEFLIAAGVLTRFPIATDAAEPGAIAAAGWAFPLVGGGIGALCAAVFFAAGLFGLPVGPAALLAVAYHLFVTHYEEPTLARLFGEPYARYRATIPRWLPRWPARASRWA